jgi:hypothetical protein
MTTTIELLISKVGSRRMLRRKSLRANPLIYCDGTWNVGGQSQGGPIRPSFSGGDGDNYEQRGSTLNVRVSDGKAYWLSKVLYACLLGPILIVWGSTNIWRRRR